MRRSKNSTKCAEINGWPSDDPKTWNDEQHAIFQQFKDTERKEYQRAIDKERIANGELAYIPVSQLDPNKHKEKKDKGAQNQKMSNDIRRALRTIAETRGLATFSRFKDATIPNLRKALYKTMSKQEVDAIVNEIKKKFKENPYTPKEPDENGVRKPGPARNADGETDPEELRKRAMGRESTNRGTARLKALYEEALKYEALSPISYYKNDIDKLRDILRKYVGDRVDYIEEEAVREYDESIQDEKAPRKDPFCRSTDSLEEFLEKYPHIPKVRKVGDLNNEDHKLYRSFLRQSNPDSYAPREKAYDASHREERAEAGKKRRVEDPAAVRTNELRSEEKQKNRPFKITKEIMEESITKPCYYCGDDFQGPGVDAVDINAGFVPENVQPCCKFCNVAKGRHHWRDFVRMMCNVGANRSEDPTWAFDYTFVNPQNDLKSCHYRSYANSAEEKGRRFELSQEMFQEIVVQPCKYCRRIPDNGRVGVDRVDSKKHYTKDNVVPCCGTCNRMKRDHPVEMFLEKAVKIFNNWSSRF